MALFLLVLRRVLLLLVLLVLALLVPAMTLVNTESGTRWLLEHALQWQGRLVVVHQSGALASGVRLKSLHWHARKFDIYARDVYIRLSLVGLLNGKIAVEELQAADAELNQQPPKELVETRLVRLWLPVELQVDHLVLGNARIVKGGQRWQATSLVVHEASWQGTRLRVGRLDLRHQRFDLSLAGLIRFQGRYPLQASGFLRIPAWQAMGVAPFRLQLARDLANLHVDAMSEEGAVPVLLSADLHTTVPYMPMQVEANWKNVKWPWPAQLGLVSGSGNARMVGDLLAYRLEGKMQAEGKYLPKGNWDFRGDGNWGQIRFERLGYAGLGGKMQLAGPVRWAGHELHWALEASADSVMLARQWPRLTLPLPVLDGKWGSRGDLSVQGSMAMVRGTSRSGESLELHWLSPSWPWRLEDDYSAKVNWSGARRELAGLGVVTLPSGSAEWYGPWSDHEFLGEATVSAALIPEGSFSFGGGGRGSSWQLSSLDWQSQSGNAGFNGRLTWRDGWEWNGSLDLSGVDPSFWFKDWPGRINGALQSDGIWGRNGRRVQLGRTELQGTLRSADLKLEADSLKYQSPERWMVQSLLSSWGENSLQAEGGRGNGWNLQLRADIPRPQLYRGDVAGHLKGEALLRGETENFTAYTSGTVENFAGMGLQFERLAWQGDVAEGGYRDSNLSVQVSDAVFLNRHLDQVSAQLVGTREVHQVRWSITTPNVEAAGVLSGSADPSLNWTGLAESAQAHILRDQWVLAEPFDMHWWSDKRQLGMSPHCWRSGQASLCNEDVMLLGSGGHMRLKLENLPSASLGFLLPPGLEWDARLQGGGVADWQEGERPSARFSLDSREGRIRLRQEGGEYLDLPYRQAGMDVNVLPGHLELGAQLESAALGHGTVAVRIDPYADPHPMQGSLLLEDFRVNVLKPFFPLLKDLDGRLSIAGDLRGTIEKPDFVGRARWQEGLFAARRGPVAAESVDLVADIDGRTARFSGRLKSGEGSATVAADADWRSPEWTVKGELVGKSFSVKQPPMLTASVDPDLQFNIVPGQVRVDGKVFVPRGRLVFRSNTDRAVTLSPDVVVGRLRDEPQENIGPRNWQIISSVDVVLGDEVFFNGFDVNGRLLGGMRLKQDGSGILSGNGEVNLDSESYFRAYGQKLQIRRGRVLFAGPINQPQLDVEAVKEVDGKVVGVRIEGRASAPQSVLISDNNLSEDEISSYLLFGRPPERKQTLFGTVDPTTGQNDSGGRLAALQLGAIGGQKVADDVGQALGLRDLELATEGAGDDTRVAVGGYIAPNLYLRYGVGVFTPVNRLTLRYRLTNSFYMEAVSAVENALDFFYTWKF